MRWIMTGHNIDLLWRANKALAEHFITFDSFCVSNDPGRGTVPGGLPAAPVMRYTSYARFHDDIQKNRISRDYQYLMYDPENWPETPDEEKRFPITYLQMFGQKAHAEGFRALLQPARNLALVSEEFKRSPNESLDSWYLRSGVPMTSARYSEGLLVQSQAHQTEGKEWEDLLSAAKAQVSDANPFAFTCGGLSTARGNAYDMFNAAILVPMDGYYVTMGDSTVKMAVDFFAMMEKAGY